MAMIVLSACTAEEISPIVPEATVDIDATVDAKVSKAVKEELAKVMPTPTNLREAVESGKITQEEANEKLKFNLRDAVEKESVIIECMIADPDATTEKLMKKDVAWQQFRGNHALTGRSELIGTSPCPRTLWSLDLGASVSFIEAKLDKLNSSVISIPNADKYGKDWEVRKAYELNGRIIDLDGKNNVKVHSDGKYKVGDLVPGIPGYERVSCDSGGFQKGAGGDDPLPCYLQNWVDGTWNTVWVSEPFTGFTNDRSTTGQPIIGDFDADGDMEVAVVPWYDVQVMNLSTGKLEYTGNYQPNKNYGEVESGKITEEEKARLREAAKTTGRPYGFFGAYDLGGDNRDEFVILGDFEKFISVLGWNEGELIELWDHQIEAGTTRSLTSHDTGVAPVGDIDGDGFPEIVTSIFNEQNDQKWHTVAFDGMTGDKKLDLADRHLEAMADLNSDGDMELFVTVTQGAVIPKYGPVEIIELNKGETQTIWASSNSGFHHVNLHEFPLNVNSRSAWGNRTIFIVPPIGTFNTLFATRLRPSRNEPVSIEIYEVSSADDIQLIGSVTGQDIKLAGFQVNDDKLRLLIQAISKNNESQVTFSGLDGTVLVSGRVTNNDAHPAARSSLLTGIVAGPLLGGTNTSVLVQGFGEVIHALEIDPDSLEVRTEWVRSGRGMVTGSDTITANAGFGSIILANVYGSGEYLAIAADKSPDGMGVIKALDAKGTAIWETTFPIQGDPPIWNQGGVTNWTSGNFRFTDKEDILVSIRSTMMHSDHLYLLDGRSGEVVWTRDSGGFYSLGNESGAGGIHLAIFDWDEDGLDEILNTYSSLFAVYDGADGSMLLNRWMTGWAGKFPPPQEIFKEGFLEHPIPVADDFIGNGSKQILIAGIDSTIAILDRDGDVIWNTPMYKGAPVRTMQGVADLNGDNGLELVSVGHCDADTGEIVAYEGVTGEIRWEISLPQICGGKRNPTHVVTVDLDGDGREEAIFAYENVIYCIGETVEGIGRVEWKATFGSNFWESEIGELAIASIDGSGNPQILLNTASSYIFSLGQ